MKHVTWDEEIEASVENRIQLLREIQSLVMQIFKAGDDISYYGYVIWELIENEVARLQLKLVTKK